MRLLEALKHKKSLKWGIMATMAVAIILPVIQTGFFQNSIEAWYLTLIKSPLNSSLYILFSLLFGSLITLQVYNLNRRVCDNCDNKKGYGAGAFGVVLGTLVGICPACIGLLGLILPLSGSLWLTYYGWVFMLIAIGIMLLTIYLLGGFRKD